MALTMPGQFMTMITSRYGPIFAGSGAASFISRAASPRPRRPNTLRAYGGACRAPRGDARALAIGIARFEALRATPGD